MARSPKRPNQHSKRRIAGTPIRCAVCGEAVGQKADLPAIKLSDGSYRHAACKGR